MSHIAAGVVAPASSLTERRDHLLPTPPPLQPLFPDGALRRGSIVAVTGGGATSLTLALLAGVHPTGAWCAAVGMGSLGLLAAQEAGVDLSRFALIADPGPDWPVTVAALLDAFDVVALRPAAGPDQRAQRRLAARVRERRRALLVLADTATVGRWSFDLSLAATSGVWEGLGWGAGHLRSRQLQVRAEGRRLAGRARQVGVWLPDHAGTVAPARPAAAPVTLREVAGRSGGARPSREGVA